MIELDVDDSVLARFARELDAASPAPCDPDLSAWSELDREAARFGWAGRIIDEYRSVAVFSELLMLLADLEAPYPALCAVQHLIGDELRHARMCADVVRWLGGTADLVIDLTDLGLPPRPADESKSVRALRIVARELVVAEEESVPVLAAYRDATTAPPIKAVFTTVLRDEARHAAAGRALLRLFEHGALAHTIDDDERAALAAVMTADRAELRAQYAASATGGPGRGLGGSITAADLLI